MDRLSAGDGLVVLAYFALSLGIALAFRGRASRGASDFFLSGRSLPWWLAGTSMVATTFAADTPLAVTELVAKHGLAGNWIWWSQAFGSLLTVFFFAKLWRRSGVMTDAELAELRYAGRPAAFLRAFRALYLALPVNLLILGWVNLAMATILKVTLGMESGPALWLCFGVTTLYTLLSGLWGVVITDFFQFAFAMAGCAVLAFFSARHLGGLGSLLEKAQAAAPMGEKLFALFPEADSPWMPLPMFLACLGVAWWASWYPGAEPGGGGYVAQRIFSTKNERHAVGATLWFAIAHYALRPWPWVLAAFASLALYPGLEKPGEGYVRLIADVLPSPLKGFLLAAFAAAYMSTVSTHLNWGASYLVGDVYKRFLDPKATDSRCVLAGRLSSLILALLSLWVTRRMGSVSKAWLLLIALGAGCGPVYLLRWYWWRVNAYSEIAAMLAAAFLSLGLQRLGYSLDDPNRYAVLLLATTAGTSAVWLAVTYLTPPEPRPLLEAFYRKVSPSPLGWGPVARSAGPPEREPIALGRSALAWALGCVCVYSSLGLTGELLLGRGAAALALAASLALSAWGLFRLLRT